MSSNVYLGLVHYPVYNKKMEIITTSITNLDIHDIARCSTTYDLTRYFVIHPLETQHELINEIINYWQNGYGSTYNPDRKKALELVELQSSVEDTINKIKEISPGAVNLVVTDARVYPNTISYRKMREIIDSNEIKEENVNYLLLFGTGYGMGKDVMESAEYVLEPIYGRGNYNHLSVRSAVSIILDRLLGEKWYNK